MKFHTTAAVIMTVKKYMFVVYLISVTFCSYKSIGGFDNTDVLAGRPFGGCATLWRKSIDANVTFVHSDNRRLCVLRVCIDTAKFLFITGCAAAQALC